MSLSQRVADVRARTHSSKDQPGAPPTRENGPGRPSLRVVTDDQWPVEHPKTRAVGRALAEHLDDAKAAADDHPVTSAHPPTVMEALEDLWPARDEVRHGLVGQLVSAAGGVAQVAILSVAWGLGHVGGRSKTQAGLVVLVLIIAGVTYAVASHV